MIGAAGPAGPVADLAGNRTGHRDEVLSGPNRQILVNDQHVRKQDHGGDRLEVARGVIGQLAVESGTDRQFIAGAHQQRVSIRIGFATKAAPAVPLAPDLLITTPAGPSRPTIFRLVALRQCRRVRRAETARQMHGTVGIEPGHRLRRRLRRAASRQASRLERTPCRDHASFLFDCSAALPMRSGLVSVRTWEGGDGIDEPGKVRYRRGRHPRARKQAKLVSCSWCCRDRTAFHDTPIPCVRKPPFASVSLTLAPNFAGYTASTSGSITMATLPASLRVAGSLTASGWNQAGSRGSPISAAATQ